MFDAEGPSWVFLVHAACVVAFLPDQPREPVARARGAEHGGDGLAGPGVVVPAHVPALLD